MTHSGPYRLLQLALRKLIASVGMWGTLYAKLYLGTSACFLSVFGPPRNLQPHYNIAPTETVDVSRLAKHGRGKLVSMRWSLVPAWWKKSPKEVPATFTARAEAVADKPMFRTAFKERRCIVPASGFSEWTGEKGAK